ncbi:MAG: hypothetical protein VKQ33_04500 [Candidatus Sericytochromatia bacterium]|nr:hypothetical protein [Candidatus Sericytochromatia bacterium]
MPPMPHPAPPEVTALVARHFDTRYGVRDDAAHLETWAEDAFVVQGEAGVTRDEADREALLAAWAGIPRDREPQLLAASVEAWHPEGEDRGLAEVDLREAVTGTPLRAVLGLVCDEGAWRVAFGALHDGPPRSWEAQRMAALSELAGLKAATLEGPLTSLLEASYRRLHRLPKARLLALPETHFSCAGTGACCRHALTIGLDAGSVAFVEAVDWEALAPEVAAGPYVEALPAEVEGLVAFRHRLARTPDGRCRFLSADNRCTVHALAGRAVFKPCHVFPYRFALTPDGVCVTVNHMCPTARLGRGAPLASQEHELRTRLAVADVLRAERYFLRPGEAVSWEEFRTIEGQLLAILQGVAPVRRKLWVALRWLQARLEDPAASLSPTWEAEPVARLGWLQRLAFRGFGAMLDPCFKDLRGVPRGERPLADHEAELTRFFRSLLFSKVTTFPYGLVAGLNYLALVHHVLERQAARHAPHGISEAFWREFYAVVTSGVFFRVLQVAHQTPATRLARNVGDPAFGLALLRL